MYLLQDHRKDAEAQVFMAKASRKKSISVVFILLLIDNSVLMCKMSPDPTVCALQSNSHISIRELISQPQTVKV